MNSTRNRTQAVLTGLTLMVLWLSVGVPGASARPVPLEPEAPQVYD